MSQTYFLHYRHRVDTTEGDTISCRGGATMAIRIAPFNKLVVGVAQCSFSDVFDRKMGRVIAEGRLNAFESDPTRSRHIFVIDEVDPKGDIKDIVDNALGDAMATAGLY